MKGRKTENDNSRMLKAIVAEIIQRLSHECDSLLREVVDAFCGNIATKEQVEKLMLKFLIEAKKQLHRDE